MSTDETNFRILARNIEEHICREVERRLENLIPVDYKKKLLDMHTALVAKDVQICEANKLIWDSIRGRATEQSFHEYIVKYDVKVG